MFPAKGNQLAPDRTVCRKADTKGILVNRKSHTECPIFEVVRREVQESPTVLGEVVASTVGLEPESVQELRALNHWKTLPKATKQLFPPCYCGQW